MQLTTVDFGLWYFLREQGCAHAHVRLRLMAFIWVVLPCSSNKGAVLNIDKHSCVGPDQRGMKFARLNPLRWRQTFWSGTIMMIIHQDPDIC